MIKKIIIICLITFFSSKVMAKCRSYEFKPDDSYQWLSVPNEQNKRLPAVLISHSSGGTGLHTATWQNIFSQMGYVTYVINHYSGHVWGPGSQNPNHAKSCIGGIEWEDSRRVKETLLAINYLREHPKVDPNKIILIGFSAGAGFTPILTSSKNSNLVHKAIVVYGWGWGCKKHSTDFKVPTLILNAEKDPNNNWCWPKKDKNLTKVITYKGAYHAWDWDSPKNRAGYKNCPPGGRFCDEQKFDEEIFQQSVKDVKDFLLTNEKIN